MLERQLKEMEREKERELTALRREKRELVHTTQTVRGLGDHLDCGSFTTGIDSS